MGTLIVGIFEAGREVVNYPNDLVSITIQSHDMEASLNFYDLLGFTSIYDQQLCNSKRVVLLELLSNSNFRLVVEYDRNSVLANQAGNVIFTINKKESTHLYERLAKYDECELVDLINMPHMTRFVVKDPSNNLFAVSEVFPEFIEWD